MERHESGQRFQQTTQQHERSSYLMEYVRKIQQEREHNFRWEYEDMTERLYIPALQAGEHDVELSILADHNGNIRGGDFTLEVLSEASHGDRYTFKASPPYVISKQMWAEGGYETVSQDDIVGQEEVAFEVGRILLNTMVERPVTTLKEEQEFWQIAVATSVEDFEAQGVEVAQYFEGAEGESDHGRMTLGLRAIWNAAYPEVWTDDEAWMVGATSEDVARYCWRRMRDSRSL